jgi:hypothetical protein
MPIMPRNSIVPKSRQGWKLAVGIAGLYLGAVTLWWGLRQNKPEFAVVGLLVGILPIIVATFAIRCRRCGARWLWIAVSTHNLRQWWEWLLAQTVCPKCGDDPALPKKPQQAS